MEPGFPAKALNTGIHGKNKTIIEPVDPEAGCKTEKTLKQGQRTMLLDIENKRYAKSEYKPGTGLLGDVTRKESSNVKFVSNPTTL